MGTPILNIWDEEQQKYVSVPAIQGRQGKEGEPGEDAPQDAVRYSEQALTTEQQAQARQNIGIAQADQAENDEKASSYIKNRTHWVETIKKTLVSETVSGSNADSSVDFGPEIQSGEVYEVIFDGVTYANLTCSSKTYMDTGFRWVGNPKLGGIPNATDTGEPFCVQIVTPSGGTTSLVPQWYCKGNTTHTVALFYTVEQVHKLDEKYLPGYVSYDGAQKFTEAQQQQARKNIGAFPSKVLRYFFDPTENSNHYNDTDIFDAPIGSMISPGNDYSKNGVSNEEMEFPVYVIDRAHITEQYEKVTLLDGLGKVWLVTLYSSSPRSISSIQRQHNEILVANLTENNGTYSIDIDWDVIAKHIQGDGTVYLRAPNYDILPCISVNFDQASGKVLRAFFAAVYPRNNDLMYVTITCGSDGLAKTKAVPIPILPPLVCTFTQESGGTVSASPSEADIYDAWFKGCPVYATIQFRGRAAFHMVPLTAAEYNEGTNTYYLEFSGIRPASFGANMHVPVVHYDGTQWSMYLDTAVTADNIPKALKNPNALTIKVGDNTVSYDGSSAQEVEVPVADKSLGLSAATVGQIAKITAVDADGKPTAWEATSMPNGLPSVTSDDNDKFLRVVAGAWAVASIPSAGGVSF